MSEKTYEYIKFEPNGEWNINFNKLIDIEPDSIDKHIGENFSNTLWSWAFTEDIFQASNGSHVLDVGWYPDGDPSGGYRLVLIGKTDRGRPDWDNPEFSLTSRSTAKIVAEIRKIIQT